MRRHMVWTFLGVSCAMLFAGGCAKHDLVKKDESLAPSTTAVKQPAKAEAEKAQPVTAAPVKESAVQDTLKPISNAGELKSALAKIYFDFDSYKLSDTSRSTLAKDGDLLKRSSTTKIRIEGNCDERGSDEYNIALGEKRAKAAMEYLVTMGIPASNLSVVSYGKEKPADPGHDEAAWAKNRRDEFVVTQQ